MKFKKYGGIILLRADKGDEIISCIEEACSLLKINGGMISGIGAASNVAISTYLPSKDIYREDIYNGVLEIITLGGNVSVSRNRVKAHIHALFSYADETGRVQFTGGHLKSAVISHTAEIFITRTDVTERVLDADLGIEVWDL